MRSVVARLARLERMQARTAAQRSITVRFGHLKQLPPEYAGDRHVVTVKQPRDSTGAELYEFEERPGPEPVSKDLVSDDSNDHILTVMFVDSRANRPVTGANAAER